MPALHHQPLALRLIKAIALWGMLVAALWAAAMGVWAHGNAHRRLEANLQRYAETMAANAAEALWQISPELVQGHLETALGIPGTGYLAVYGRGEKIPFGTAGNPALAAAGEPLRFPIRRGPRHGGLEIGELEVQADPAALRREAFAQVLQALWPGLALTGLLMTLALVLIHRRLHRPLTGLSDFLDRLGADAQGQAPVWAPPPGRVPDELDRVAASLAALQQRVGEHVQQLDARVAERTVALEQALRELRELSSTDPLTGCRNRMAFNEAYAAALASAARYDRPLTVVICDVDRFKSINDRWGHLVGDRVLAAVGAILRQALRAGPDWVARYGGEEFVLVLPETPLSAALEAAERVRKLLAEEVCVPLDDGARLGVTASFGLAQWRPGETGEQLLARADAELYAAKHAGRDCVMPALALPA